MNLTHNDWGQFFGVTMDLGNKDLNLLLVFSTIWEERHISRAAAKLFVSQSAVSHSLKKLREQFNDPLFVRSSSGMVPTDFSVQIAPHLLSTLDQIEKVYNFENKMDLKDVQRTVVISSGDYFSMTQQQEFLLEMNKQAPRVRIIFKPVTNILDPSFFENGEVHIGITAISFKVRNGFYSKVLYKDKVACCVRKGHPILKDKATLNSYLKAEHLNVSNFGKDLGVIDLRLSELKKRRNVNLVVSSFYDAARIIRSSNFVLSAPKRICESLSKEYNLKTLDLPFVTSTRPISIIWHERTNDDPFHKKIRDIILATKIT